MAKEVASLGDELIGDAEWELLFSDGLLVENPQIDFKIRSVASNSYSLLGVDQVGTPRPENTLGDIGSIELQTN